MPMLSHEEIRASVSIQQRTCVYCWFTFDTAALATHCEHVHEENEDGHALGAKCTNYRHDVLGIPRSREDRHDHGDGSWHKTVAVRPS